MEYIKTVNNITYKVNHGNVFKVVFNGPDFYVPYEVVVDAISKNDALKLAQQVIIPQLQKDGYRVREIDIQIYISARYSVIST